MFFFCFFLWQFVFSRSKFIGVNFKIDELHKGICVNYTSYYSFNNIISFCYCHSTVAGYCYYPYVLYCMLHLCHFAVTVQWQFITITWLTYFVHLLSQYSGRLLLRLVYIIMHICSCVILLSQYSDRLLHYLLLLMMIYFYFVHLLSQYSGRYVVYFEVSLSCVIGSQYSGLGCMTV